MDGITTLSDDIDLVFSPDDGGFYLQLYLRDVECNTKTSQIFDTQAEALQAYKDNQIIWE